MCAWELDKWGDIANIIIAVASVATAIVTARMLIKQHKLQKEQHALEQSKHELEKKKLEIQQLEHQPVFYFKRNEDSLEICNSGTKLMQPIRFGIRTMVYVEMFGFFLRQPKTFVSCFPVKLYRDCSALAELEGVVGQCPFNKEERDMLHKKCFELSERLSDNIQKINAISHTTGIAGLNVRVSDLLMISYKDIYKKQHICYYSDSTLIDEQCHKSIVNAIRSSQYKPNEDIAGIDVEKIVKEALQFRNLKNWQI